MKKVFAFVLAAMPSLAFAQLNQGVQDLSSGVSFLKAAITTITQLILAVAVVFFMWNAFKYVKSGGDEEGKSEARGKMIYGVVGIAVMVSLWGLVNFLTGTAKLQNTGTVQPPVIPGF